MSGKYPEILRGNIQGLIAALIAVYYGVAIAYYVPVEGWGVFDCIYFATVIFTPVALKR